MRTTKRSGLLILLTLLFTLSPALPVLRAQTRAPAGPARSAAASREGQWEKVRKHMNEGLPKSAIAALEPIIVAAMKEGAHAEAIRAIGLKIALEGNIEGNKPEEKIFRLQAELEKVPAAMKAPMEAVLAHWYWQYFQHNRWRFLQRTQTAEAPGPDLQTWDLKRILAEIDHHFAVALANEGELWATPVSAYDGLLEKGTMPDSLRPTMFDFLAHEALQFYQAGEQGGAAAEDAFVLDAESPILGDAAGFMTWKPDSTDETSPTLKAIALFQKLMRHHWRAEQRDENRAPFAEVDLERILFGKNKAAGETTNARTKAALKQFAERWNYLEVSARALAEWAQILHSEEQYVEARAIAQRGLKAFPDSPGGAMCFNLIQQIEAKSASIQTERSWTDPLPTIDVSYRNVTKAYFRAVPFDFEALIKSQRWGLIQYDEKLRDEILSRRAAMEWQADLPPTEDFAQRTEKLPAPEGLKPGFYFIVASHDARFREDNNQVSVAPVWVSDLALVVRTRHLEGVLDGFVLKARTGDPMPNVVVRQWTRDNEGWLKAGEQVVTDANGMFRFLRNDGGRQGLLIATDGEHKMATAAELWVGRNQRQETDTQTVFFTDRALYRPGQSIYYKGIRLRWDHAQNKYETLANQDITVVFNDPNGKEIARATHTCNDYGSFDGVFTAPRDRVMGMMTIQDESYHRGATTFNVEEYKRPKFQVTLEAPAEAARLDREVILTGKAAAYTGAAIGGAKVKWRVMREVRFPPWCWWWMWCCPPNIGQAQAIAHGTAETDNDGTFKVAFIARPDRTVPKKNEPIFAYQVYADVTDTTGETRSAERTVRAGYTALQATIAANEWLTPAQPVEFRIRTTSLDDVPQAADVAVKVHRLKQPARVMRAELQPDYRWYWRGLAADAEPKADPADPNSWELADVVGRKGLSTDKDGGAVLKLALKPGIYRAMLETKDRFGQPVTARHTFHVVDPAAAKLDTKVANLFLAPQWSLEPGASFQALWGTGYDTGRAFVEIEHRGKPVQTYWTEPGRTQAAIESAVTEDQRGGFTLRVTYVRENRAYLNERVVDVPWSNKELTLKWERFRSKLGPGEQETWTAVVTGPDSKRVLAEMVAGLYDASLDQYRPHDWMRTFNVFRRENSQLNARFENHQLGFQILRHGWSVPGRGVDIRYRTFPAELVANLWGYGYFNRRSRGPAKEMGMVAMDAMPAAAMAPSEDSRLEAEMRESTGIAAFIPDKKDTAGGWGAGGAPAPKPAAPNLDQVTARKNLNETAFFFPRLTSDLMGVVKMEFTMPEALTEWKFLGFAHDRELRAGFLTDKAVTAKDLMVEPNPPRFVREGDVIEFTVKVSNQSDARQKGQVRLTLTDARTLKTMDGALGNAKPDLAFDVPAKQSRSYAWRLRIPDGCEFLTYKAVGATDTLSDGEEGPLPVLSRRILVTESLPLPIRGKQVKEFEFKRLMESGKSDTLRHQSLTVQMVSQPAWYAVMALPYLMEYPYECSEQTFNRLYANALARHIANADPKIRRVFDQWKGTPALDSPLEKNQDLKSVLLEETPWYRQAMNESQARRNVGILFDANRLNDETARTLRKLAEMQLSDGLWPWFPGGRPNEYITLYITTGFGRLRHLGVELDMEPAFKSLTALDAWMEEHYRQIQKMPDPEKYVPGPTDALYLYGRSFFLKDREVAAEHRKAVEFFLRQSRKFWLKVDNRQSQAHLALALQRFGDAETPVAIMKSIKERSVSNEELGMFWRELELSWWWFRAPIETQAMMIEAFAEVMNDAQAVEDCKVWLLKQKQTQDWKTTKATADAIYGLLLRGQNLLASDALVEVALAGKTIKPEKVEAGTGFYEQRFEPAAIVPEMGKITVTKVDEGVSWGSLHWQYLEDMTRVTPYEGTPLKLKKALFIKETTKQGQVLKPVNGPVQVGDELVVRIELRTDRDMEYVHLKDQRGSGTEPVNVLSQYRYQDGLAYYESTRDTASHFFIDYLPKGVYVFEYSTRVQLRGVYQSGVASIQSMYAPEFNSHSESFTLEVR